MNDALAALASDLGLAQPAQERLRLAFAAACIARVRHLLEQPEVDGCVQQLLAYLAGDTDRAGLQAAAAEAARLANRHPGSASIDGCGHAAVSASHAVAQALAGRALEAASYAAYAIVYAQGGAAAVADRDAFAPEFAWQVTCLRSLAAAPAALPA